MSQEERLMILQMVADKKITATEAAELLRALGESKEADAGTYRQGPQPGSGPQPGTGARPQSPPRPGRPAPPDLSGLGSFIETMVDKVGSMFSDFAEPRYELPFEFAGEFAGAAEIPLRVINGNGKVEVRAWDQSGYKAIVLVKSNGANEEDARSKARDAFTVKADENGFELEARRLDWGMPVAVHVELMVPREKTYRLEGRTGNGKAELVDLILSEGRIQTGNGKVTVIGGSADRLSVKSGNGQVHVESDVADLEARTGNGSINVVPKGSRAQTLRAETGNGSILVDTGRIFNGGFKLEALTGMGGVTMSLPNLVYEREIRTVTNKHLIARTQNFDEAAFQVVITARAGMGSITVE